MIPNRVYLVTETSSKKGRQKSTPLLHSFPDRLNENKNK